MRKEFERVSPESVGIPSSVLEELLDALEGSGHTQMHGLIVMRKGKICAEGFWTPFGAAQVHSDHSLSKTYTATAVGICQREGLLSLEQKIIDFFPEDTPEHPSEWLRSVTIRDLLIMGGGFPPEQAGFPKNWISRHLGAEMEHEPGTFWRYDSHGTTLLSAIVEKITGMSMVDWLAQKLFSVIGIDEKHVLCRKTEDGICIGGGGLFTTAEDNLRLMKLYLDGGVWEGTRLLEEQFVHEATTCQLENWDAHAQSPWIYDNRVGYGYQIWMCRPEGSYRADGAFGQFCIVIPSEQLIVSILEAGYNGNQLQSAELHLPELHKGENRPVYGPQVTLDILFSILLPALRQEALPEDPAAWHHLRERLSRLRMPDPWGEVQPDWTRHLENQKLEAADQGISFGPLYGMKQARRNRPQAQTLCMKEEKGFLLLQFIEDGNSRELKADMTGSRQQGILSYDSEGEILSKVSCSAWFTKDGILHLSVLWYETEIENVYTFSWNGDLMTIEKRITMGLVGEAFHESGVYRRMQ